MDLDELTKDESWKSKWKLSWLDPDSDHCEYMHCKEIAQDGRVLKEFALNHHEYVDLYYSLMDWFMDTEVEGIPHPEKV